MNAGGLSTLESRASEAAGNEQKTIALLAEWKRGVSSSTTKTIIVEELLQCGALDRMLVGSLLLRPQVQPSVLRDLGAVIEEVLGDGDDDARGAAGVLIASLTQLSKTYGRETIDAARAMRAALAPVMAWLRAGRLAAIEDAAASARAQSCSGVQGGAAEEAWRARFERMGGELPSLQQAVDDATSIAMKAHAATKVVQCCHERVELLQPGSDARVALSGAAGKAALNRRLAMKKEFDAKRGDAVERLAKVSHCIDKQITSVQVAGDSRRQQEEVQKLILQQQQCAREEEALEEKIANMERALAELRRQLASSQAKREELGCDIDVLKNKKNKPLYNLDVAEMKSEVAVFQKIEGMLSSAGAGGGRRDASGDGMASATAVAAMNDYIAAVEDSMSVHLAQQVELASRWTSARSKLAKAQANSGNANLPKELRKKQDEITQMLAKQVKEHVGLSGSIAKTAEDEFEKFQLCCSASTAKAGRLVNVIKAQYDAMVAGRSVDGIVPEELATTLPQARAVEKQPEQKQQQPPPQQQHHKQHQKPQQQRRQHTSGSSSSGTTGSGSNKNNGWGNLFTNDA